MNSIFNFNEAVTAFKTGELVAFPTDTVYGIGCDPYNDDAVGRLFVAKSRPKTKSIPLLIDSIKTAETLGDISEYCKNLLELHWPGALTIIVRKKDDGALSKNLSTDSTIALRMPNRKELLEFITSVGGALAATSANMSGEPPLTSSEEVFATFPQSVSVVLSGFAHGETPSTIINCTEDKPFIVRQGSVFI